jgi:hypothetical protein
MIMMMLMMMTLSIKAFVSMHEFIAMMCCWFSGFGPDPQLLRRSVRPMT